MVERIDDELLGIKLRKGTGGLNTRDHPVEISEEEFAELTNFEPRRAGLLQSPLGCVTVGLAAVGALACHGMGAFRSPIDTDLLVAAFGSTIYKWNGTATIDAITGVSVNGTENVRFCQAMVITATGPSDYWMFALSPSAVAVYWDGSAAATAPNVVRGSDAIYWLNRMWVAGNPTMQGIIFPSSLGNPATFILSDGYGIGDGDRVMRIFNYFEQGMLVFLKHSIGFIDVDIASVGGGFATETSSINIINHEIGTVAPESVVQAGRDFFFLSRWGVHKMSKTEQDKQAGLIIPISDKIQDTIDRINWAAVEKAVGVVWQNKYKLAVPLDSATDNSHTLVYDMQSESWKIEQGVAVGAYAVSDVSGQDELYFGSAATLGTVYKDFSGTSHAGAAIPLSMETKRFDFGDAFADKIFEYVEVEASSPSTVSYTLSAQKEDSGYVQLGTEIVAARTVTLPVSLPFVLGSTALSRRKWPLNHLGTMREVQLKVTGSVTQKLIIVGMNLTGYFTNEELGDGSDD